MKKLVLFIAMVFFAMTAANVFAGGESLESVFYSLDVDKDGKVTREELCAYYTDTVVCAERFYFYDQNDDDELSLEEFVGLALPFTHKLPKGYYYPSLSANPSHISCKYA